MSSTLVAHSSALAALAPRRPLARMNSRSIFLSDTMRTLSAMAPPPSVHVAKTGIAVADICRDSRAPLLKGLRT